MINLSFPDNKVYFIDIRKYKDGIKSTGIIDKISSEILKILPKVITISNEKSLLMKTHIGEPLNDTFMNPELLHPLIDFAKQNGLTNIVLGDTTVAYSGERGYKENPENNCDRYLKLVKQNGFFKAPFVVLDRPITGKNILDFNEIHIEEKINDQRIRYKTVYPSGGFLKPDIIINNAHLTGHLIAMNAMCIKSIAMGFGSYQAKIQLHQNLYPEVDDNKCIMCYKCINNCPVEALSDVSNKINLNKDICIGCGQCASVCPNEAIMLTSNGISTWNKGNESLDVRMCEYAIALLSLYKGKMLNIGHLYNITGMCDCMNVNQKPNCPDIGLVIGLNPFAVDFTGTTLEGMMKKGDSTSISSDSMLAFSKTSKRYEMYEYVNNNFNIDYVPDIIHIEL